jgi:hypothetical protein
LAAIFVAVDSTLAQVFIESIYPPSLQRGETNRVTIRGSRLNGATGIWSSLPTTTLHAQVVEDSSLESALVEIHVAEDAPLGLYGLRLATQEGLSNVHLFAIDDIERVAETEYSEPSRSNNHREQAQEVPLPIAVMGSCRATDLDYYAINVGEGERVSIEVIGNRLGKAIDPLVTIFAENGEFLAEHDNDVGLFFDCRFEHVFDRAGRYIVRVTDTRFNGSEHWTYLLRMGRFPVARVALPSTSRPGQATLVGFPQDDCGPREVLFPQGLTNERFFLGIRGPDDNAPAWLPLVVSEFANQIEQEPNDTLQLATPATVPSNLHGVINRRRDTDGFAFELRKGQHLEFRTDTRDSGSAADLALTLIGPDEKTLKTVDDNEFDDAAFDFAVPADGRYVLQVVEVVQESGPEYAYRIEVHERAPEIDLTTGATRLAVPQGTWQPVPLQLTRQDFSGEVILSLRGAPPGMSLLDTGISADESSIVSAISVDTTTPPGIYTVQIEGQGSGGAEGNDGNQPRCFARTQPLVDRLPVGQGPHGEPFELRKDQRRLPPSLTNRIAVLVLPPAPFDFEITTPVVTLPRYSTADLQMRINRTDGFDTPIRFVARGGQLDKERLRKPRVTTEIPEATTETPIITSTLQSLVSSEMISHFVTVTATAQHGERTIHLTRTFQLEVKVAFAPTVEPPKLNLQPGESASVRLVANRLTPFDGELTFEPGKSEGIQVPGKLTIPIGQDATEFEVSVAASAKPGTYKINLPASTRVNQYFESAEGESLEIVIPKEEAADP